MKKKRIWFNRWFSTVYHLIEEIRHNPDGEEFAIYGTHPNADTVYFQVCDYSELEPVLDGEEYIQYCLDFCSRHHIDVFIPYQHALTISRHLDRFAEIGTKVLVSDNDVLMETMSHKGLLYESFCRQGLGWLVPAYRIVNTAEEFARAYEEIRSLGLQVCMKPADGRGGEGFRIIREEEDSLHDLLGHVSHYVSYKEAFRILSAQERFADLMVMEHLSGYEYSIDCLAYEGELLAAVPRKKAGGRVRQLEAVPELLDIADAVQEAYQIPYVYNVQVKYSEGVPKLLEINPRMSGGLHISALSGVNFAYLAVKLLLTGEADPIRPKYGIKAAHVEKAIVLKE